jgi:hypothetical protein
MPKASKRHLHQNCHFRLPAYQHYRVRQLMLIDIQKMERLGTRPLGNGLLWNSGQ